MYGRIPKISRVAAARSLFLIVILVFVAWVLSDRLRGAQDAGLKRVLFEADESNRRVNGLFEAARVVLDSLSEDVHVTISSGISADEKFQHRADRTTGMPSLLAGAIVQDAEGRIIAAAAPRSGVGKNLGNLDYFVELREHADRTYSIGAPFRSKILGATVIPFARAIRGENDAFLGVVALGIRLSQIQNSLAPSIETKDARSRLWRTDGLLIASSVDDNVEIGRFYPGLPLFSAKREGPGGYFVAHSPLTGEIRLSAWRDNSVYPYFVSTGANRAKLLERDYLDAAAIAGGAVFLIGIYFFTILLVDSERSKTRSALAEKSRALDVKTMFLANMSHEFRTPLNAISGYTQMLHMGIYGALNDKQKLAVSDVSVATDHLTKLTETLLDLSRIETGRLQLDKKRESIAEVIDEALTLVAPQAENKRIAIKSDFNGSEIKVFVDRQRTRQILVNLLSNAIDSVPDRGVVEVRRIASADEHVLLAVVDDGPGLGSIAIEKLFQPFSERDATKASKSGVGLGLSLARGLARAQGGEVALANGPKGGAIATVALPKAA